MGTEQVSTDLWAPSVGRGVGQSRCCGVGWHSTQWQCGDEQRGVSASLQWGSLGAVP